MRTIASRPSAGRLPCAARPCVSTSIQANPLWATAIARSVGSVTTAASARQRVTSASAPALAYSSSMTAAITSRPRAKPASATMRAASIIAATPPFMSWAPRPYRRPSRWTGSNGAVIPSTPTVSVWPQNIRDRPAARPSRTPTTLGRPGAASCNSTSIPIRRIASETAAATAASPAAPGTSNGLTESIATRSRSS